MQTAKHLHPLCYVLDSPRLGRNRGLVSSSSMRYRVYFRPSNYIRGEWFQTRAKTNGDEGHPWRVPLYSQKGPDLFEFVTT